LTASEKHEAIIRVGDEGERIEFGGYDLVFKSPAPGSVEGPTVVDYTLGAKQPGAPLHYHRKLIESFFVVSGELWMRVGDREFDAGPGTYVLIPPGVLHSFANRGHLSARMIAQASNGNHKAFLLELFAIAKAEGTWPPRNPEKLEQLAERYDTFYLR
jgi:mannose-6-phosphate isomerase-like protein (cupin superfamily)